jgi:hypothetical protein
VTRAPHPTTQALKQKAMVAMKEEALEAKNVLIKEAKEQAGKFSHGRRHPCPPLHAPHAPLPSPLLFVLHR